jgi:hypothetical protein
MEEPIVIKYQASTKATLEAMFASGRWIMGPWWWLQSVFGVLVTALIVLGGGALTIALGVATTGLPDTGLPYVWIGALVAGALFIVGQNLPPRRVARHIVQSPYSQGTQTASFDQTGLTIKNAQSCWQTDWVAIENVKLGKNGILVQAGAVAFAISVSDMTYAASALTQIERWKQAA